MGPTSGYRLVAHTADVRVKAWARTREECVAQAIQGMVASFAQVADGTATAARECPVQASNDDDLLLAALEEVIYLLDTARELPATVTTPPCPAGCGAARCGS